MCEKVCFMVDFTIEFHSGIPVYRQIINRIQADIAAGTLKEGDRLPTIHALTDRLGVNPNTVAHAYREMELTGVIASQRGNGSFVRGTNARGIQLAAAEKEAKLDTLYGRMKAEASSFGISETEIEEYLKERIRQ